MKRRPVTAFAEPEPDEKAVEARMYEYIRHMPQAAKPLGIRVEQGIANGEDIERTIKDRLFVRFRLKSS